MQSVCHDATLSSTSRWLNRVEGWGHILAGHCESVMARADRRFCMSLPKFLEKTKKGSYYPDTTSVLFFFFFYSDYEKDKKQQKSNKWNPAAWRRCSISCKTLILATTTGESNASVPVKSHNWLAGNDRLLVPNSPTTATAAHKLLHLDRVSSLD